MNATPINAPMLRFPISFFLFLLVEVDSFAESYPRNVKPGAE